MKSQCRIYWKIHGQLRSFYWVTAGSDQSVYFGSSASSGYRKGWCGSYHVLIGGRRINPKIDGRPMTLDEITGKHSLHKSGIMCLPTINQQRRDRHRIAPTHLNAGAVPLAGILPMDPLRYPLANRASRDNDLLLDICALHSHPFAVLFYIKKRNSGTPAISRKRANWSIYELLTRELGDGLDLCAMLYGDSTTFTVWPDLEHEYTSRAKESGGEPVWPLFQST